MVVRDYLTIGAPERGRIKPVLREPTTAPLRFILRQRSLPATIDASEQQITCLYLQ